MRRTDLASFALLIMTLPLLGCLPSEVDGDADTREDPVASGNACGPADAGTAVDAGTPADGGGGSSFAMGSGDYTLMIDGRERRFRVVVPVGVTWSDPPLAILVLHGGGGSGNNMKRVGMEEFGQTRGFITVYPEGVSQTGAPENHNWNAGDCDGRIGNNCGGPAFTAGVDDVAYLRAVIARLRTAGVGAIFVSGISNGGMMAHRAGCELAPLINGFAAVAGALALPSLEAGEVLRCRPARPLDVLLIHATNDENLPYTGGAGQCSARERLYPSVDYSLGFWREANECGPEAKEVYRKGNAVCSQYSCANQTRTILCRIDEPTTSPLAGHSWPGANPKDVCRPGCPCQSTPDLDASDLISRLAAQRPYTP